MREEHKVIFEGRNTVFVGWMRKRGNNIEVKSPHPLLPFVSQWKPVLSNVEDHMQKFSRKKLVNANDGVTDEDILLYPFDLTTFEAYYPKMNVESERELESLRIQRDYLYQMLQDLQQYVESGASRDEVKDRFKQDFEYFNNLKPAVIHHYADKKRRDAQ